MKRLAVIVHTVAVSLRRDGLLEETGKKVKFYFEEIDK